LAWVLVSFSPSPSQPSTVPSTPPSAVAPAELATFTLSIDSEPLGATVTQNGQVLGLTPMSLTLPQDSSTRVLMLEKEGYEPYVLRQAAARGEVHVRAALVARPQPAQPPPTPSATPERPAPAAAKRPPAKRPPPSTPPTPSDIRLER
jgi:hypothetical protein